MDGAAKHISIPQPLTMLHATRAQIFAVVGAEDFFLLIQKDAVLGSKQRTLLGVGMWPCHISPQKTEREAMLQPVGQILVSIQLHSCLWEEKPLHLPLKGFILALVSAEAMLPMQMEK